MFTVKQVLQAPDNDPVELGWYKGDSHTEALAALVSAAAQGHDMPYYKILSVTLTFS